MTRWATLIATWFGCGRLPWAPGSWGSLAALPCAWIILRFAGVPELAVAVATLFVLGWWAAEVAVRQTDAKDPGWIVVDEVAGQCLTLTVAPLNLYAFGAGFLLFRLFDVWKPWPVSWADRNLTGGFGIMADDILAAIYSGAVLALGRYLLER